MWVFSSVYLPSVCFFCLFLHPYKIVANKRISALRKRKVNPKAKRINFLPPTWLRAASWRKFSKVRFSCKMTSSYLWLTGVTTHRRMPLLMKGNWWRGTHPRMAVAQNAFQFRYAKAALGETVHKVYANQFWLVLFLCERVERNRFDSNGATGESGAKVRQIRDGLEKLCWYFSPRLFLKLTQLLSFLSRAVLLSPKMETAAWVVEPFFYELNNTTPPKQSSYLCSTPELPGAICRWAG